MRKSKAKKRILLPDPKFNDILVTRFVNNLMYDGKKSIAYDVFYDAMEIVQKRTEQDGLEVFKKALSNITPSVEVRSRRWWCYFPDPFGDPPRKKTFNGYQMDDPLRS